MAPPSPPLPGLWSKPVFRAWDGVVSFSAGMPWPPWGKRGGVGGGSSRSGDGGGDGLDWDKLLWYLCLQVSVCVRQLEYVRSDFSMHLPTASPALLYYFVLPSGRDPMRRLMR